MITTTTATACDGEYILVDVVVAGGVNLLVVAVVCLRVLACLRVSACVGLCLRLGTRCGW